MRRVFCLLALLVVALASTTASADCIDPNYITGWTRAGKHTIYVYHNDELYAVVKVETCRIKDDSRIAFDKSKSLCSPMMFQLPSYIWIDDARCAVSEVIEIE